MHPFFLSYRSLLCLEVADISDLFEDPMDAAGWMPAPVGAFFGAKPKINGKSKAKFWKEIKIIAPQSGHDVKPVVVLPGLEARGPVRVLAQDRRDQQH